MPGFFNAVPVILNVIPAQAGIQGCEVHAFLVKRLWLWIPACAGMTTKTIPRRESCCLPLLVFLLALSMLYSGQPAGDRSLMTHASKIAFLLFMLFLMACPAAARAQMERYMLDKPHTQVIFSVSHLGFSHSYGKFTDYDGMFTLNHGNLAGSSVDVSVKTDSLDMGDAAWNKAVKGSDFFDVIHYPVMRFKSTGIETTGPRTAKVTGDLTLRGVTKPATFDVTLNKTGRHPFMEAYVAGLSADGVIDRSDFGMGSGIPFVGDEVRIHLEIEGHRIAQPGQEIYNP